MQGFADSRSRLELFLAGDGGSEDRNALDVSFDAGSTADDEFGDVVDVVDADSSSSSSSGSFESAGNTEDSEEDAKVDGVAEGRGDEAVLAATMGEEEGGDVGHGEFLPYPSPPPSPVDRVRAEVWRVFRFLTTALVVHVRVWPRRRKNVGPDALQTPSLPRRRGSSSPPPPANTTCRKFRTRVCPGVFGGVLCFF